MQRRVLPHGHLHDEVVELVDGQGGKCLLHLEDAGVLLQEPGRQAVRGRLQCDQVLEEVLLS
eukprot:12915380-Prorocentrum_lima.AAC.1